MAKKVTDIKKFANRDKARRAASLAAQAIDDATPLFVLPPEPLVSELPAKGKGSPRGKKKK